MENQKEQETREEMANKYYHFSTTHVENYLELSRIKESHVEFCRVSVPVLEANLLK